MPTFAPRIHVLLARDAPVGLVIRRGPSKQVATLMWDRTTDEFQLGQWLKGRIYERRCDLSPRGTYFIYFAMKGKWKSEAKGSWTAISRAPYLKALALFPKGDCWNGGGLWTANYRYWLNDGCGHSVLHDTKEVHRDGKFTPESYGGECPGVYYPRLIRDGWELKSREKLGKWSDLHIFEKPLPQGWILRKMAHSQLDSPEGKGCYWDEHALVHAKSSESIAHPTWEWADLDGKRVAWATGGKLFAAKVEKTGLDAERELFDFNDMRFEAIEAPY